jgi:hypothetical protein
MGCGRNVGRNFESTSTSSSSHNFTSGRCVCDVVRAIKDIQDTMDIECPGCPTNCFLEPLGGLSPTRHQADTRVFMLLTKDGTPFKAFFRENDHRRSNRHNDNRHDDDKDDKKHDKKRESCFSVFFRVEEVFDDCCATLRVLEPQDRNGKEIDLLDKDGTKLDLREICEVREFELTDSCVTVDLNCFCGIECVADAFLGVCD